MLRIVFTSPDLADFESAGADDHIKIFVPGDDGEPVMRDYTPRVFDRAAQKLTLDFALHEAGPATAWALAAKPGDTVEIGGPRGSRVVTDDFDWYLLIADETGLPSIGRRLEELRAGVPAITLVTIETRGEVQPIETRAAWEAHWICRDEAGHDDAAALLLALQNVKLPRGDGYIWIAAEASVTKALKSYALGQLKHPPAWMRAGGYWLKGTSGAREALD